MPSGAPVTSISTVRIQFGSISEVAGVMSGNQTALTHGCISIACLRSVFCSDKVIAGDTARGPRYHPLYPRLSRRRRHNKEHLPSLGFVLELFDHAFADRRAALEAGPP